MKPSKEIQVHGNKVSGGIAIGKICFLADHDEVVPEFSITKADVEKEITRYRSAICSSRADLFEIQKFLEREGSSEAITIIDTHIQMLEDPFITVYVEGQIRQMMKNTESVFRGVMNVYEEQLGNVSDPIFQQRVLDVKDLSKRIMRHLHPDIPKKKEIPIDAVLFAKDLIPSDAVEATHKHVQGFITERGGGTSHAALIARAKGIPFLSGVPVNAYLEYEEKWIIVDGDQGIMIIDPSPKTIYEYELKKLEQEQKREYFIHQLHTQIMTKDEKKVEVWANIDQFEELKELHRLPITGIGLLRTEFFFMNHKLSQLTEEMQYETYQEIYEEAKELPIVFRLFDIGGDKGEELYRKEMNPALGFRAIRFLLNRKRIFRMQIRALLRACGKRDEIRLLLPLISAVTEIREAKKVIREVYKQLLNDGELLPYRVLIGSMIEVPSAVMTCEDIAKESDFLSIGTNDLVQYTLAVDRANQDVNYMYQSTHPSIIKMLEFIIQSAQKENIPLSICGEIASDGIFIPLLLGLGICQLSCSIRMIPEVISVIGQCEEEKTDSLLQEIAELDTAHDIYQHLKDLALQLRHDPTDGNKKKSVALKEREITHRQ